MGLLDRIKRIFNPSGIDVDLEIPDTFRFQDGTLPVTVRITSPEPRVVTGLELVFDEYEDPTERQGTHVRVNRRHDGALRYHHPDRVELAAGVPAVVTVDLPLSLDALAADPSTAPAWLSTLGDLAGAAVERSRTDPWFQVRVVLTVDGFSSHPTTQRKVRNLRAGETGGKGWSAGVS